MRPAIRIANGAAKSRPSSHSPAGAIARHEVGGRLGDRRAEEVARLAHPEGALERRPHARVLAGVGGEHHPPERRPHQVLLDLDGRGGAGAERLARGRVTGHQPSAESRQPRHGLGARGAGRAQARRRPPPGRRTRSRRPAGNRCPPGGGLGGVDLGLLQQRRHGATVPARGRRPLAGAGIVSLRAPRPHSRRRRGIADRRLRRGARDGRAPAGRRRPARRRRVVHPLVAAHRAGRASPGRCSSSAWSRSRGSHPLAKKVGAWPAVLGVSAAAAAAAWVLADRDGRTGEHEPAG